MSAAQTAETHTARSATDPGTVIAFCVLFALTLFLPSILNDGDTLWQIRTGEWILDHHAIPAIDPFSFSAGDRRWFAHEWLAETLLALAHRAGGMQGVMVLSASAVGLTAAILWHHIHRVLPGIYAVLALVAALANAAPSMLARPHLLAWPCLVVWCGGLVTARANRTAPSWMLLPVMLVWVNLHGSFMLGLLLPIAFMLEALLDPGANHRAVLNTWARFIAGAWLAALINPEFLSGLLFPFNHLGLKSLVWIGEWQPTDFSQTQPLELMILAGLALGLSGQLRLPPVRLIILLGLVHGALTHARNEQLLGLVGVLVLAHPIGAAFRRTGADAPDLPWRGFAMGAALLAAVALVARISLSPGTERTGEAFAAVIDHVPPKLRPQPVLNDYSLGGKLIFAGVRPVVDSRADLYGDEFLIRYRDITAPNSPELDRVLGEYQIVWTIFPAGHRILAAMDQMPGWQRLAETDGLIVHARTDWAGR